MRRRQSAIKRAESWDLEKRTVVFTISSETPCPDYFGTCILDHSEESVDLSRFRNGSNLLFEHNGSLIVGVIERAEIVNKEVEIAVRFAKDDFSEVKYQQVLDGIIRNVSVSAKVSKMKRESKKDEYPVIYRATRWQPSHASLVGDPADSTVGILRSNAIEDLYPVEIESSDTIDIDLGIDLTRTNKGGVMPTVLEDVDLDLARKLERERIKEIYEVGKKYADTDLANKFIDDGSDIATVYRAFSGKQPKQEPLADLKLGFTNKEQKSFSVIRAIRDFMDGNWGAVGFKSFELECHEEMIKRTGVASANIILPFADLTVDHEAVSRVVGHSTAKIARATYATNTPTTGGNLVATILDSSSFYDILRTRPKIMQMGARMLAGLVGNLDIPRRISTSTAYWVPEGGEIPQSEGGFGKLSFRPNTLAALSAITRLMMLQSTPDIEQLVREDLVIVMALAMDLAAIAGSGLNSEPRGILNTAGIGNVTGGANGTTLTYDNLIDLETKVSDLNADEEGQTHYFSSARGVGVMKKLKDTAGSPMWIGTDSGLSPGTPGMLNGYPVMRSNQVPRNLTKGSGTNLTSIIYGDFSQVVFASWGILDLLPNPFGRGYESGTLMIRAMQTCDIQFRRVEAFAAITDLVATI